MIITNKAGLPDALVRAVNNDGYSRGKSDISVTQLIDSPMVRHLRNEHREEIEEDVADRIWSLMGQSIHSILERANLSGLVEQRIFATINGKIISGQFDHLDNEILSDYKMTSVWSVIYGKTSWGQQLNVLDYLCSLKGLQVAKLQIIAILRDWQHSKTSDPDYPQTQVVTIPIERWTRERQLEYIEQRLRAHFEAEPSCSDEERWKRPDTWAVMKKGRKTALRVLDREDEALRWKEENGGDEITHRPGSFNRCDAYCNVNKWCPLYTGLVLSGCGVGGLIGDKR